METATTNIEKPNGKETRTRNKTGTGNKPESKTTSGRGSETDAKQWTVDVTCEGITPLLCDAMSEEKVWEILGQGKRPPKDTTLTKQEIADSKVYRDDGAGSRIGIPAEMLFACLRGAGRKIKVGRNTLSTASTTQLPSFLTIEDSFLAFLEEEPKYVPDVRRGMMRNSTGNTACAIVRPKFAHWSFKVRITVDLDGVEGLQLQHVRDLFRKAGSAQGLGSYRPSCNGSFGRFRVVNWKQKPSQD